jgi:hypothetical protein
MSDISGTDVVLASLVFGLVIALALILRILSNEATLYEAMVAMSVRIGEIEDAIGLSESNITPDIRDGGGIDRGDDRARGDNARAGRG